MKQNRTNNTVKNSMTSLFSSALAIIIEFISRTLFINILGVEYLGLDGLFANVLSMLNLFELGIGSAIIYNMYKPIAEDDKEKIKSLLLFYKKAYNIIAITIFLVGSIVMLFVPYLINGATLQINYYLVFFLSLLGTVSSYMLTYKRTLLYAYQSNYIVNIIHLGYLLIFHSSKIIILILTKSYYLYLIIKIISQIIENLVISYYCDKKYPYIKEQATKLSKEEEKNIFKKVKALIFHQIGGVAIFSTDNIIISKFLNVAVVGVYSNYSMIINHLSSLFGQIISSATASIGNLLTEKYSKKTLKAFNNVRFINFWISCFTGTCLLCIVQPFITLWLGKNYLLNIITVIILVINYYQHMQRAVYDSFKNAAGIWEPDKYVPLIEASINLVSSIILVNIVGLPGVFIGTFLSGLVLWIYSYPKYVYKGILRKNYMNYFKETLGYFISFVFIGGITFIICTNINVDNKLINLIVDSVISLLCSNLLITLLYRKKEEFKYSMQLLLNIKNKLLKNNKTLKN